MAPKTAHGRYLLALAAIRAARAAGVSVMLFNDPLRSRGVINGRSLKLWMWTWQTSPTAKKNLVAAALRDTLNRLADATVITPPCIAYRSGGGDDRYHFNTPGVRARRR